MAARQQFAGDARACACNAGRGFNPHQRAMNTAIPSLLRPVRQIWLQRSLRERLLLQVAAWLIGAAILWTLGLGTFAFNMQDIVLEPYGGEILHLSVGATSALTALLAGGGGGTDFRPALAAAAAVETDTPEGSPVVASRCASTGLPRLMATRR